MATLNPRADSALRRTLSRLAEAGELPDLAETFHSLCATASAKIRQAVLAEIPAFGASANPAILPSLERHIEEHLAEIRRLLAGGEVEDFAFVKAHARLRAEQRFPLEATLEAYQLARRVLNRQLIAAKPASPEATLLIGEFATEYASLASAIGASEYVQQTRRLADAEGDLRTELLALLLSGYDEADARAAAALRRAGYLEQRVSYCVVVARSVIAAEMESHPRAQRLVSALADAVADTPIRKLGGMRDGLATMVFSDLRRMSGWTPSQARLSHRLGSLLLVMGPAVLVGVSADHPSTSFIPKALNEAKVALDFTSPARRLVSFGDLSLRDLLVHRGANDLQSATPRWAPALLEANARAEGALIKTLRALADADLNIQQAARALGKHPNTIYARIARIRELTGLDAQRFHDLNELALAADFCRM